MNTDFRDAHERHWEDAELLFEKNQWANADHLYGIAAECGLKSLMLSFGMPFDSGKDRPQEPDDRTHIDTIQTRYETYRCQHPAGKYILTNPSIFDDWKASQRYANRSNFDCIRATTHRKGAIDVCNIVRQAQLDGLLA